MYEESILIEKIEKWLLEAPINSISDTTAECDNYISELKNLIKEPTSNKQVIGKLIAEITKLKKELSSIILLNWVPVGNGFLSVGHRPGSKLIKDLKLQGASSILTLLAESEGAKTVEKFSSDYDLDWIWYPMSSAQPPNKEHIDEIIQLFEVLKSSLEKKGRIYIHCSAGIHRTGMISYAFLRYIGLKPEQSMQKLLELRKDTYHNVGDHRIQWGEDFISGIIIN